MYDDDSDEKRSTNMNMGPRTWYQVPPRELRYPEVRPLPEKSHLTNTEVLDNSQQFYYITIF